MSAGAKFVLLGLDIQALTDIVSNFAQPQYRARQLYDAIYAQRRAALDEVSTLPRAFRDTLANAGYEIGVPRAEKKFTSIDGTIRYLIGFGDGQSVETVWMPEGDGGEAGDGSEAGELNHSDWKGGVFERATICVSSQVGCAVNCQFCMTALLGAQRNLAAGEIVGQVLAVLNDRGVQVGKERINIVFMGQGEPLLNYANFIKAVRLLADPAGVNIPSSRMTVSTAGIVPRIYDLGKEAVRPKLAISLNGSNDAIRERVMPINRKWNIAQILEAARAFPLRPRERLTFEYVLLDNVNDFPENAREVARLLQGLRAKVNLIALNPGPDIPFSTPGDERVRDFQETLMAAGIPTFIRRPRGRDIYAACGQLKRTVALTA
jgi:23S rRNA (adenine2503-C2)-methyltransferase